MDGGLTLEGEDRHACVEILGGGSEPRRSSCAEAVGVGSDPEVDPGGPEGQRVRAARGTSTLLALGLTPEGRDC